jgi:putative alpha-1,2-mannosidase
MKCATKLLKQSTDAIYIKQVTFSGKLYTKNYIRYADIMKGGVLDIYLQQQPSSWGTDINSRPSGLSD